MRHLGSIVLSVLLAPVIYVLIGVGQIKLSQTVRGDITKWSNVGISVLAMLVAAALYAVLTLTRLSPIGPALVGVAAFAASVINAGRPAWIVPHLGDGLFRVPGDTVVPLTSGVVMFAALPLVATVVSARRWRGSEASAAAPIGYRPPGYPADMPSYSGAPAPSTAAPSPTTSFEQQGYGQPNAPAQPPYAATPHDPYAAAYQVPETPAARTWEPTTVANAATSPPPPQRTADDGPLPATYGQPVAPQPPVYGQPSPPVYGQSVQPAYGQPSPPQPVTYGQPPTAQNYPATYDPPPPQIYPPVVPQMPAQQTPVPREPVPPMPVPRPPVPPMTRPVSPPPTMAPPTVPPAAPDVPASFGAAESSAIDAPASAAPRPWSTPPFASSVSGAATTSEPSGDADADERPTQAYPSPPAPAPREPHAAPQPQPSTPAGTIYPSHRAAEDDDATVVDAARPADAPRPEDG